MSTHRTSLATFELDDEESLPDNVSYGSQVRLLGNLSTRFTASGLSLAGRVSASLVHTDCSPDRLTTDHLTPGYLTPSESTSSQLTPTNLPSASKIDLVNRDNCDSETYKHGAAHRCSSTFVVSLHEPAHHTFPETAGRHATKHKAMFQAFMEKLQTHPDPDRGCESIIEELNKTTGKTRIEIMGRKDKKVHMKTTYESGWIAHALERTKPGAWGKGDQT
jgi:hypothetical protein